MSVSRRLTSSMQRCGAHFMRRCQRRFVHRSPDRVYLSLWQRAHVDYRKEERDVKERMYNSPRLVENIMRAFVTLKKRGYVPFIHAAPAASRVVNAFARVTEREGRSLPFRQRSSRTMAPYEVVIKERPKEAGARDSRFLSMSYALTSGVRNKESAASFGFRNHDGKDQYWDMLRIFEEIVPRKMEPFYKKGEALIRRYNRLKVGDFYVVGVPKGLVRRTVYDAKPYNVPSGHDVVDVANHPERYEKALIENGCHMATMVICREVMDPKSGIVTIHANDEYVAGSIAPLSSVKEYRGLVSPKDTDFEEEESRKRKEIDRELQKVTEVYRHVLRNLNRAHDLSACRLTKEDEVRDDYPYTVGSF